MTMSRHCAPYRLLTTALCAALSITAHAEINFGSPSAIFTQDRETYGGIAWGDVNGDNYPDLAIAKQSGVEIWTQNRAVTFTSSDEIPASRFQKKTALNVDNGVRSVVWGDYNADGRLDLAAAGPSRLIVWQQDISGVLNEAYRFDLSASTDGSGLGEQVSNTAVGYDDFQYGGEGLGWIDHDSDGDIDLLLDKGGDGIRLYENVNGVFTENTYVTLGGTGALRGVEDLRGDNVALADFDVDGDVDAWVRRENNGGTFNAASPTTSNLWVNNGGVFQGVGAGAAAATNFSSLNRNDPTYGFDLRGTPGAAVFCDFDNDGDLDAFSTGLGPHAYYENMGATVGGEPQWEQEHQISGNFNIAVCGDFDNDGDMDLWLGTACDCGDIIQENVTNITAGGNWRFESRIGAADNSPAVARSISAAAADVDRDGDLDLAINVDTSAGTPESESNATGWTHIWPNRQSANIGNYLAVRAVQSDYGFASLGATLRLRDCPALEGDAADSGAARIAQAVSGGEGRGSQSEALAHFGLATDMVGGKFVVEAIFPGNERVYKAVNHGRMTGYKMLAIQKGEANDLDACFRDGNDAPTDPDDDDDGVLDIYETGDRDNDGIPDRLDLDSDNDGIPDTVEYLAGVGYRAWDSNNDSRVDSGFNVPREVPVDTDGDGTFDIFDLDSNNDGLPDLYTTGADTDLVDTVAPFGQIDASVPVGSNGLADALETNPDSGVVDVDGDGVRDEVQDSDDDDAADFRELDADGDRDAEGGGNNIDEIGGTTGLDGDGNGILDVVTDVNNDGLDDALSETRPVLPTGDDSIADVFQFAGEQEPGVDGGGGEEEGGEGTGEGEAEKAHVLTQVQGSGAMGFWVFALIGLAFIRRQRRQYQ